MKTSTGSSKRPHRGLKTTEKTSAGAREATRNAKRAPKDAPSSRTRADAPRSLAPPDALHWDEALADGTRVSIRPIRREDAALERDFIKRLSPETRRMRFLGQMSEPSDELIRALTDIDYRHDMAFVALVDHDGQPREIGVSRYGTSPDGKVCECAVTVSDEWQQRGVGTLLMRHLIDVARSRGIRTMVSYDAAGNLPMRDLAAFLGFERRTDPRDSSQVIHTLHLR